MKWPANRIITASPKSFGMYEKSITAMKQGRDLIHLEVGRPRFDTPLHIKSAAKKALDDGLVHYGEFAGNLAFREAIAEKLKATNGIAAVVDEIIVTNGLTHGTFMTCLAALNPGDEAILLEPYYPQHINKIELAGAKVITAALDRTAGFRIDGNAVRAKLNHKTRMISLVNPANPTGRVFSREELQTVADIAIENDLLVMADEVYEQIVYDDNEHISIASLDGMRERTITHFAFTKGYAMDGWRIGYLVAPQEFMPALLTISTNDATHVNVFVQEGGRAAISGSQDCVAQMVAEDKQQRDVVVEAMNAISGIDCPTPQGTIYAFPDISSFGTPAAEIADDILEKTDVVVEAGTFYGASGEGHLRICFGAESPDRIEDAMQRLKTYFANYESSATNRNFGHG